MRKNLFIVMAAMLVVALSFTSCSEDTSPSGVVKAYTQATQKGDMKTAVKYLNIPEDQAENWVERMQRMYDTDHSKITQEMNKADVVIRSEEVNGDRATVEMTLKMKEGMSITQNVYLTLVDGKWKVQE